MSTKITREQLRVLEDAYKFDKVISNMPAWTFLGLYPRPKLGMAVLDDDTFEEAITLENELLDHAKYMANVFGKQRRALHEIVSKGLGLEESVDAIDLYHVWNLYFYCDLALAGLADLHGQLEDIAQDLGQEYDKTEISGALEEAVELVSSVSRVVEKWEKVAAQRFVETGTARPAEEAAK